MRKMLSVYQTRVWPFLALLVAITATTMATPRGAEPAPSATQGDQPYEQVRVEKSLNSGWRFKRQANPGSATEAEFLGAERMDYNDSTWETIALPHTWDATWDCPFPTSLHFRGVGWYRRWLDDPSEWRGRRLAVHFKGVFQIADVWVNGQSAGRHVGGFTGFELDITDLLKWSSRNLLAVRVDDVLNPAIAPANETNVVVYGGIYRSVSLVVTDPVHVRSNGTWVTTERTGDGSVVRVRLWVENSGKATINPKLHSSIVDEANQPVASFETTGTIAPGETKEFDQKTGVISNPHLWSPDTPYLYRVVSTVSDGSRIADRSLTPFGIRFITVDPAAGFVLNGKPINLHGVDRRQDYGFLGDAVPEVVGRRDIRLTKDMGANFLRTAHYPQDPAVIDECDRLGILVWEEIPNIKIHIYPPVEGNLYPVYTERFPRPLMANLKEQMKEMIERDRNHPSIIIWGLSDDLSRYHYPQDFVELSNAAHGFDPTRWTAGRAPHVTDIMDATSSYDFSEGRFDLLQEHQKHPEKGYIWNEWGAFQSERGMEGAPYHHPGESEDSYSLEDSLAAMLLEGHLMQWNALPWLGTAKWCMFDTGEVNATATRTVWDWPFPDGRVTFRWPFNDYLGVSDMWRLPKNGFHFLQSQWTEKPMVHIVGHWTWPDQVGRKRQVRVYSNCATVELELNGHSQGIHQPASTNRIWKDFRQASDEIKYRDRFNQEMLPGAMLKHPPFIWDDVPYEKGTLVAIGRKGSETVRDELRTAGAPTRIVLKSEKAALAADLEDVSFIEADVVDANGTIVPDAIPWIQFSVSGPGRLLGGATEIDAIAGVAAINVQATGQRGEIVVGASADGLSPGSARIRAETK